ncbi:hypothetical protein BGZ58_003445 [Dissophora ornata]|nr:hypothetical protein BGZ58_003445 [Dissophora ornata]
MTFSTPQPIPSRSSHPVLAHQRPPVRRSQSHTASSTNAPGLTSSKFGLSRLLASDDLSLTNDHDENRMDEDDEEDEDEDEDDSADMRVNSGHYSDRGIPIGKPGFLMSQKNNGHLYATAGGSVDSRNRLSLDFQIASRYKYSHSHSNSDSHSSMNLIADNFKTNSSAKTNSAGGHADSNTQNSPSLPHFQYQQPQLQPQQQPQQESELSPSNTSFCSPSAPTVSSASSTSLPSPSLSPATIAIPQQTLRRDDAYIGPRDSSQDRFERSSNTSVNICASINTNTNVNAHTDTNANGSTYQHTYPHPNISIDTSKARLLKTEARAVPKPADSRAPARETVKFKRAASLSIPPSYPNASSSSLITPSSSSSTRPLLMASQSRLSSALPPTPTFHQHSASAQDMQSSVLLPSLSPSSPRVNSALVNSLEQLSVSWKAPENTPSFPINRLHRSRTISSGARPIINSSFSSNGTLGSSISTSQFHNNIMSPGMITSSSYSSLPYSPAVAFLSNFVDVTAPRMAPDEEGEQVGDFIMGKIIGHGGFSLVREAFAIHLDGMVARVAVKIVKTQTGATDNDRVQHMLDKEIAIWSRLSHPNVLPFLAVEKLPTDTFVFCELCTGGHLLEYLTRQEAPSHMSAARSGSTVGLEESQARVIFNQVAEALRYLHEEKRIVHRDIKLENILQHEDGTWKICDFGLAEYQNDEAASYFGSPLSPTIYNPRASLSNANGSHDSPSSTGSLVYNDGCFEDEEGDIVGGSLAYCSPEQLRSTKPLRCPSSDVWSLGVVLYALLTGRLPFQDEYEPRLQYQILNGRYEDPTECSPEARDLLKNMFRSKPEDRWRIGQVIDSPWCMGTTLEASSSTTMSFGGFGGFGGGGMSNSGGNNHYDNAGGNSDHAKMNNFFATFRF